MCEIDLAKKIGIDLFADADKIITASNAAEQIAQDTRKKVVLKHWRNYNEPTAPAEDLSWANLVILYSNDVITGPWESYRAAVLKNFNNDNFICVTEGRHNLYDHPVDRVYEDHEYHASRIVDFCQYEDWPVTGTKPKLFDALIGSAHPVIKPHREFVFDQLKKHNLLDQSFVNIWGSRYYRSPELKDIDDPAIVNYRNSMIYTDNFKNGRSMSHSIPIEIYRQSWYSIVTETQAHKSNYVTEKTSKPLFEKRLFVMFGPQGLLSRLHKLGYQTFDGIIDESYDDIDDPVKRWTMAFEQVLKLATADHQAIYDQAIHTLNHNHAWIVGNHYNRLKGLKDFLDLHISKL
jgi:hypothetical protein